MVLVEISAYCSGLYYVYVGEIVQIKWFNLRFCDIEKSAVGNVIYLSFNALL